MTSDDIPIIIFGAAIVGVLSLTGSCAHDYMTSTPQVSEVTITDKNHVPGHYDTHCSTDSKGRQSCSEVWVAPTWTVQYEDVRERFRTSVSSGTYGALKLGDRKVMNFDLGSGFWQSRYNERFLLVTPSAEGSWPVR